MTINKNTKEGRKQLLDKFIARCELPIIDKTNFAKGSKVFADATDPIFTVVVSQAYGVQILLSGYGWTTNATQEQQDYLTRLAETINGMTEWGDMAPQEGPLAP